MTQLVQGREHEWLFSSPEGQQQLAAGCASRRVVIVSLGRGHTFPPMAKLKVPLSSPPPPPPPPRNLCTRPCSAVPCPTRLHRQGDQEAGACNVGATEPPERSRP